MHILMRVTGNFNLIIDSHDLWFVLQALEPFLCQCGIPWLVGMSWVGGRSRIGTISEQAASSIRVVRIKSLLVWRREDEQK